jgi:ABC-type tungstate transport system permease subunit
MNVVPHKTIKYNDPCICTNTNDPPWTDLREIKKSFPQISKNKLELKKRGDKYSG